MAVTPSLGLQLEGPKERIYELQQLLGRGGFGSVWRAEDVYSNAAFAIKIFESGVTLTTDEDLKQAYEREVALLHDVHVLRCPHIIRMDESFRDGATGLYCIVMGLAGEALQQRMLSAYALADVLRWTRQLATALACLSSVQPESVVHGDINPENLLICPSSSSSSPSPPSTSAAGAAASSSGAAAAPSGGDLVLADLGGAMWHQLRAGPILAPWLVKRSAFMAPERRLDAISHAPSLSVTEKEELADRVFEKVGGGRLDVWSLGVVAYLLGLRKGPAATMTEVDGMAQRADASGWLQAQLQGCWPGEEEGQLRVLAEVIAGALHPLDGRLSAEEVLELMGPEGTGVKPTGPTLAQLEVQHKQLLAAQLQSRPGLLGDERVSLLEEDVVPLDLLPSAAVPDALAAPCVREKEDEQLGEEARPVSFSQLLSGEVCGKGLGVILGAPGAGKTTLLHHLALRMALKPANGEVPVVVHAQGLLEQLGSCADLTRPEALLGAVAVAVDGSLKAGGYPDSLLAIGVQARREARAVLTLLVDGLDEVADSGRVRLLQWLIHVQAASASPFRRVIVCSRPGAFASLRPDHSCLEAVLQVLPLDRQRSERLVEGLRKQWGVKDAELAGQVRALARSTFQGSPLLLYLLCVLARERGVVPDSSAGLFEEMLWLCLRRAEAKEGVLGHGLKWDEGVLLELCGLVAYLVHGLGRQDRKVVVMKQQLIDALGGILRSEAGRAWADGVFGQRYVLKQALAEALDGFSGLFCEHGRSGYQLLHRNLQEYLAARFLARHTTDPLLQRLREYVCAGQWGFGDHEEATAAWRFEWSAEELITADWWAEVYRFAGLLRGPTWLAERLLRLSEASARAWLEGIGQTGLDPGDVGLRRLRHVLRASAGGGRLPHARDRETAALAVGVARQVLRQRPALAAAVLFGSTGPARSRHTSAFLSQSEWCCLPGEAVTALCQDLVEGLSGPEGHRHVAAFQELAQAAASRPGVVEALVSLLNIEDRYAAYRAAQALGNMGEAAAARPGVVEVLMGLLSHRDTTVASSAADALGNMGSVAASRPGVVEALVAVIGRADRNVAFRAVGALSKMGEAAASGPGVEALMGMLSPTDADVASGAAEVLGKMGEAVANRPDVVEALLGLLGHANGTVAYRAAEALGNMGKAAASRPGVVEALLSLLGHTNSNVGCSAAQALGKMGRAATSRPGVADALASLLGRGAGRVVGSLSNMGDAAVSGPGGLVEVLTGLLGHPDRTVVSCAAEVFGNMGPAAVSQPGVVEALVRLLGHADPNVAFRAAAALGKMGKAVADRPGVVEGLLSLLSHGDSTVVSGAADALGKMGEAAASRPGVVEALVGLLSQCHTGVNVPLNATVALGKMAKAAASRPGVVEALVCMLSRYGSSSAVEALGNMGEAATSRPGVVEALVGLLSSRMELEVWRAAEALGKMGEAAASEPSVVNGVMGLLRRVEPSVVSHAAEALGNMGERAASAAGVVDALLPLLSSGDRDVASRAAEALGKMGEAAAGRQGVVEALVPLLCHGDRQVASHAANALGKMGKAEASRLRVAEALTGLLSHADRSMASGMRLMLGKVGGLVASRPAVVDALVGLLGHADREVAWSAACALRILSMSNPVLLRVAD